MTARDIKSIDKEISRLRSKKARLEAAVENTSPKLTGMPPAGGASDKVGAAVAQIADISSDIQRLKDRRTRYLESLDRNNFTENCLYLRFKEHWSWTKLSMRLTDGKASPDSIRMICYRHIW